MTTRLRQSGFERLANGFRYSYDDVPTHQGADTTWTSFFENNAPRVTRTAEEYNEAIGAWSANGGIKHLLATIQEDRAQGAAEVKHQADAVYPA